MKLPLIEQTACYDGWEAQQQLFREVPYVVSFFLNPILPVRHFLIEILTVKGHYQEIQTLHPEE